MDWTTIEQLEELAKVWNHAAVGDLVVFTVNGRKRQLLRYYYRSKRTTRFRARITAGMWPASAIRHSSETAPSMEFAA